MTKSNITLPNVSKSTAPMLQSLTKVLGVDRNILASDDEIQEVWQQLPKLLRKIPPDMRDEGIVRMSVAVAVGLFDSAVNYAWNAAITELRNKVRQFGFNFVSKIITEESSFDENKLLDLQDSKLLSYCLRLNLISEEGYFKLNQCREIRNNYSAAHPADGKLDEYEFVNFLSRCIRHALDESHNLKGVDMKEFMGALNAESFTSEQLVWWCDLIKKTYDAQKESIVKMLHSIFCDSSREEHVRITSLKICHNLVKEFSPGVISELINQHQNYLAKGKQGRIKASRIFFEKLHLLKHLSHSERHSMISSACKDLLRVHNAMDNFYNERPFAKRLENLSINHPIPKTASNEFVETIVTCSVGNPFGTAHDADIYYCKMIKGFSPHQVEIMLSLPTQNTVVSDRINHASRCKKKFTEIVGLLDYDSVPTKMRSKYKKYII